MNVWLKRFFYLSGLFLIIGAMMLITMPVQFMVIQWGMPQAVQAGTIAGTLQSGRVSDFVYSRRLGQINLEQVPVDIAWNWCPDLSHGVLTWCVEAESSLARGEGRVSYALLAKEYRVFDTGLNLYVQGYPVNFKGVRSELKGMGSVRLKELSLDSGGAYLKRLVAEGEWRRIGASEFELGDYLWRASLEPGGVLMSDFDGGSEDFNVRGQASLDPEKKTYRYSVDVMTDNIALAGFLKGSAGKSGDGVFTLSGEGRF